MKLKTLAMIGAAATMFACGDADQKSNNANNTANNANNTMNNANNVNNTMNNVNNTGGEFNASLSDDTVLGTLSQDQVNDLCAETNAWFDSNVETYCKLPALISAAFSGSETDDMLQAACAQALADCIANPEFTSDCEDGPNAACTATVAEMEACFNDQVDAIEAVNCEDLTLETIEENTMVTVTSCDTFSEKCPDGN